MDGRQELIAASAAFIIIHELLKNKDEDDESDVSSSRDGNHEISVAAQIRAKSRIAKRKPVLQSVQSVRKWPLKRRRLWMRSLFKSRNGNNEDLTPEIGGRFDAISGISCQDFEKLMQMLGEKIAKQDTYYREAIPVKDRLAVSLRFLTSGHTYRSLSNVCKISNQSISVIVPEVCRAIAEVLQDHIKMPNTEEEWENISTSFLNICNFPHCLGAMGGKHVILHTFKKSSGSIPGVVLFAVTDPDYNFIYANVGHHGNNSTVAFQTILTSFNRHQKTKFQLPPRVNLPNRNAPVPRVFVADSAFPLQENVMTPFADVQENLPLQKCYNERIFNVVRIARNAFGHLSSRFRVLRKPLYVRPDKAQFIVSATLYLHNFLKNSKSSGNLYAPVGSWDLEREGMVITEGSWRRDNAEMSPLVPGVHKMADESNQDAEEVRQEYAEYCLKNEYDLLCGKIS